MMNTGFDLLGQFDEELSLKDTPSLQGAQPSLELPEHLQGEAPGRTFEVYNWKGELEESGPLPASFLSTGNLYNRPQILEAGYFEKLKEDEDEMNFKTFRDAWAYLEFFQDK